MVSIKINLYDQLYWLEDTKRNTLGHKFEFTDFQIHSLLHEETNDLFMFNFESSLKLGWCSAQHFVGLRIPVTTGGF